MSERGVRCPRCGASTPLPDDLRVPSFACAFCHGMLETAQFAGVGAVSADALLGHMEKMIANPSADLAESIRAAPRLRGGSTESRPDRCKHCGAEVAVPLDVEIGTFVCGGCGRTEQVDRYIPDAERFELDMQRQVAGNQELARIKAEGAPCGNCGALNAVPSDGSIQFVCTSCGAAILLSAHVDASAIARDRLAKGVFAMRDEMIREQEARDRKVRRIVGVVIGVVLVFVLGINLLAGR